MKKITIFIFVLLIFFVLLFSQIYKESSDSWSIDENNKIPIVYSDNYDIELLGIQKFHLFDSEKYSKVANYLIKKVGIKKSRFTAPKKISNDELKLVHTGKYLSSLNNSKVIARIAEIGLISIVPNFILQERLLDPMRYGTGGTVLGVELAIKYGWAINLSGGYHHAKADSSGGFCYYADIPIAVNKLWKENPESVVLIIDLDAHQGNGNESIFKDDPRIFIFDLYHENNYPHDDEVKKYIDFDWPVRVIDDQGYLSVINKAIPEAIEKSKPDLIIYNAGTDVFQHDRLGKMDLSKDGIIERDKIIFEKATNNKIPILMVLSGGYSPESAQIIGESIENILYNVLEYVSRD